MSRGMPVIIDALEPRKLFAAGPGNGGFDAGLAMAAAHVWNGIDHRASPGLSGPIMRCPARRGKGGRAREAGMTELQVIKPRPAAGPRRHRCPALGGITPVCRAHLPASAAGA